MTWIKLMTYMPDDGPREDAVERTHGESESDKLFLQLLRSLAREVKTGDLVHYLRLPREAVEEFMPFEQAIQRTARIARNSLDADDRTVAAALLKMIQYEIHYGDDPT